MPGLRSRDYGGTIQSREEYSSATGFAEIILPKGAKSRAEAVEKFIMGGAAAMIVTSVLSMLFDSLFVMLQRYNHPRLVRVMARFSKLK